MLDDVARDLRYAIRQLRRAPGFAVPAILCLALGVGSTTAIYSVVNAVLLRPLPLTEPDRLVRVLERVPPAVPGRPIARRDVPYLDVLAWGSDARSLSDAVAIVEMGQRLVGTPRGTAGLWGAEVSAHVFTMLGVGTVLGRPLVAADAAHPEVAVLTFDTWQLHFAADPRVVGSTIELRAGALQEPAERRRLTVVGVLRDGFELPASTADFYTPARPWASGAPSPRATMIARLAPGVALNDAAAELNSLAAASRPPWPAGVPAIASRIELQPLQDLAMRGMAPALQVLLGGAGALLLITCANIANLLLARGAARQRELAVRSALGASGGRIIRQVVAESLVLAMAGSIPGAALGMAGVALVKRLAAVDAPGVFALMFGTTILPRVHEVRLDVGVIGVAVAVAALTSVLVGLLPAMLLSRPRIAVTGASPRIQGAVASRTRAALVVTQLALATMLLVGAGLLMRSFMRLATIDTGYDASGVVAMQLLLPDHYSTSRKAELVDRMLASLRALPGVRAAGFARHGMLIGEALTIGTFAPPGHTVDGSEGAPRLRAVSDGFLTAMRVPLLDGRDFGAGDDAGSQPVVALNRSAARRLFGSSRAVGQTLDWYVGDTPTRVTVIGVVEDVRQESPAQEAFAEVYVDYRQLIAGLDRWPELRARQNEWAIGFASFAVRTDADPAAAVPAIRRMVRSVDATVGIDALVPMSRLVAGSLARERFSAVLLGTFAVAAGLLAAIGVYGVLAYLVVQRTSEIAVRMALGAQRADVLALVLRQGLLMTAAGIAVGMIGAATVARGFQALLFGITPLDVSTFAAVAVGFGLVATTASYLPARRATAVDPLVALRRE